MPNIPHKFIKLDTVTSIFATLDQLHQELSPHDEQQQAESINKITPQQLQRLIPDIQTLADTLNILKGNTTLILLQQLGSGHLKKIIKDGHQLASILIVPTTTHKELLHIHIGREYLHKIIKHPDQIRRILIAISPQYRCSFLIDTLGATWLLSKINNGAQLRIITTLLPEEKEQQLFISKLASSVGLRQLSRYRDDKQIYQTLSASVSIRFRPFSADKRASNITAIHHSKVRRSPS